VAVRAPRTGRTPSPRSLLVVGWQPGLTWGRSGSAALLVKGSASKRGPPWSPLDREPGAWCRRAPGGTAGLACGSPRAVVPQVCVVRAIHAVVLSGH
jgi:hypothetical protein